MDYTENSVFYDTIKDILVLGSYGEVSHINYDTRTITIRTYIYIGEL